jgi:hypothetical protein
MVHILFFPLLDTLKPFWIIIINQIILSDATIRVLIFQRLLRKSSTLTNEINENLSLLGDSFSLLTLVNNEKFINLEERNSTSGFSSRGNNDVFYD